MRSLPAAVWLIGWLSTALCNLINNQPLTILMTRILLNPKYSSQVTGRAHQVRVGCGRGYDNLGVGRKQDFGGQGGGGGDSRRAAGRGRVGVIVLGLPHCQCKVMCCKCSHRYGSSSMPNHSHDVSGLCRLVYIHMCTAHHPCSKHVVPLVLTRPLADARDFYPCCRHTYLLQAALYALIVASNLGAVFTMIGALAGIMWSNVIKRSAPQVTMTYTRFLKLMPPTGIACMLVTMALLCFEYAVFPDPAL